MCHLKPLSVLSSFFFVSSMMARSSRLSHSVRHIQSFFTVSVSTLLYSTRHFLVVIGSLLVPTTSYRGTLKNDDHRSSGKSTLFMTGIFRCMRSLR
ncbi:hypothetical protein BKA59DRAFT_6345 [Fusarium tricinctum]|uniref:Uncharacterized protein n=1 Tax=Fusarium tricinctum TaxID=61284 RepID=A0A8K0S6B1_9HYPO|nr:hypothetical protein BKA59DRAFT_6345 [Fusarium tricinctum]